MIWFVLFACSAGVDDDVVDSAPVVDSSPTEETGTVTSQYEAPLWRYAAGNDRGDVVFKNGASEDRYRLVDVSRVSQSVLGPLLVLDKDHQVNLTLIAEEEVDTATSSLTEVGRESASDSSSQTWLGAGGGVALYSLATGPRGVIVEHDAEVAGVSLEEVDSFLVLSFVDIPDAQSCVVGGEECSAWAGEADERLMLAQRGFHNPAAGGTFHGGGFNEYLTTPIFGGFTAEAGQQQQVVLSNQTSETQPLAFVGDQANLPWPSALAPGEQVVRSVQIDGGWSLTAEGVADGFGSFDVTLP